MLTANSRDAGQTLQVLQAQAAAAQTLGPAERLAALLPLGRALRERDPLRALAVAQKAQEAARALDDRAALGRCLALQAVCRLHLGQYEHALSRALAAQNQSEEAQDRAALPGVHSVLGSVYFWLGDHAIALEHHYRSLRLSEETGDKGDEAMALRAIGAVYARTGDSDKAVDYFLRAMKLFGPIGDQTGEAGCLADLGEIYDGMGAEDKARDYFEKAGELQAACGDRRALGHTCRLLGNLALRLGDPLVAQEAFARALALAREFADGRGEILARLAFSRMQSAGARHWEAIETLGEALAQATASGSKALLSETQLALSEALEASGDAGSALRHHRKYHRLKLELDSENAVQRTRALQVRLEVEKTARDNIDFHRKNAQLEEASRKLQNLIQTLNSVNEQKTVLLQQLRDQKAVLDKLAREDPLTGVYNRRHLGPYLEQEFARARRFARPLSVAMVDLDHFKAINDHYSHLIGDEVLKLVALIFQRSLRQIDLVARYGGEEFVLVLPETPVESAVALCEKIRAAVEGHPWHDINPSLQVTLSIGVAGDMTVPNHEKLLGLADAHLYEAKLAGRNRVFGDW